MDKSLLHRVLHRHCNDVCSAMRLSIVCAVGKEAAAKSMDRRPSLRSGATLIRHTHLPARSPSASAATANTSNIPASALNHAKAVYPYLNLRAALDSSYLSSQPWRWISTLVYNLGSVSRLPRVSFTGHVTRVVVPTCRRRNLTSDTSNEPPSSVASPKALLNAFPSPRVS